jgi:hypothetical protein
VENQPANTVVPHAYVPQWFPLMTDILQISYPKNRIGYFPLENNVYILTENIQFGFHTKTYMSLTETIGGRKEFESPVC